MNKRARDFWQAVIALPLVMSLLAAPVAAQMPQQRPAARPMPQQRPAARPMPAPARPAVRPMPQRPQIQRPQRPAINRPTTLPSYPTNPGLERPRPQPPRPIPPGPNRPGIDRPVTLPSYPDRPGLERPPIRPLPPPRPFPPGIRPPVIIAPGLTWGYRYPVGGGGFARRMRCESWNYRLRVCPAYTNGRVVLERRHGGRCRFNRDWGFDLRSVWVRNGCRATFAIGRGGFYPDYTYGRNDTALIIGGVAVAAGLIAAIASDNRDDSRNDNRSAPTSSPYPPLSSAAIEASDDAIEAAARPAYRLCLQKAASNIAATGGDRLRVVDLTIDSLEDGQYRFDADIEANYPGSARKLVFNCTASSVKVADFDFITDN